MDRTLPNIICDQTTQRYLPIAVGLRHSEERRPDDIVADTIKATVTYGAGVDRYDDVMLAKKEDGQIAFDPPAPMAKGDFSGELMSIFLEENAAVFLLRGIVNGPEGDEYAFGFRIAAASNHAFTLREEALEAQPELEGTVWVNKRTNLVRQLDIAAGQLASTFATDHVRFSTLFRQIQFGEAGEFLLPTSSESTVCTRTRLCSHNVTEWSNCKRFAVKSRVISVTP